MAVVLFYINEYSLENVVNGEINNQENSFAKYSKYFKYTVNTIPLDRYAMAVASIVIFSVGTFISFYRKKNSFVFPSFYCTFFNHSKMKSSQLRFCCDYCGSFQFGPPNKVSRFIFDKILMKLKKMI